VYGVRCGAVLSGYAKSDSTEVLPVKCPSKSTTCSLAELISTNGISKADDTLVFKTPCVYCTQLVKVDSKEFGLPQTRQRVYMFVWRPRNDNIHDDLGKHFVQIVNFLKSPVKHSLDAFMLQPDHEIIRLFREALNGPPGRQSKRSYMLEPDFWTSASANLPHNQNTRKYLGLEDEARWLMNWGANGKKQIPPQFWLEYLNCNGQRTIGMLDILYAAGFRDAEAHDALFSSFFWNVSQNVSKEKHRMSVPGIAGCITPGGDFFVPSHGRPFLGCEKLLIQGLPYFRLALGSETEVQLGDLAGNAMSLPVVCATMLAAITCEQLRAETELRAKGLKADALAASILKKSSKTLGKCDTTDTLDRSLREGGCEDGSSALSLFQELAALAEKAAKASVLCTCETSGRNSLSTEFVQCQFAGSRAVVTASLKLQDIT